MIVQEMVDRLNLGIAGRGDLEREITGGYASDLLSCVMAGAKAGNVWVTLQAHPNVVAVASLIELAAVIITEGTAPDPETVRKAEQEGIALLTTDKTTFTIVAELAALGIAGSESTPQAG
jgi:hypothetical protein